MQICIILHQNKSYMSTTTLPTWCDLVPHERHKLLGELVDAMIYSGDAVQEVQQMVERFKSAGYVRSVILPEKEHCHHTYEAVHLNGSYGGGNAIARCTKCGYSPSNHQP